MQKILGMAFLMLCAHFVQACDICGCAASGSQLGILPQLNKHFVGYKYQFSRFISLPHGSAEGDKPTQETFQTHQLWTRFVVQKRLQIFAFLPYKVNIRNTEKETTKVGGLSDITLLSNIILFNTAQNATRPLKHALQLSAGIKLPTGKSDVVQNGLMLHNNMQVGTGSFDIPMNFVYTMRYKSFGTNAEFNFTKNGINKRHFQYGNRTATTLRAFIWKEFKKVSLLPNMGMTYEYATQDRQNAVIQDFTGGENISAQFGLDTYYQHFGINLLFQKSLYQNIGDGHVHNRPRMSANFIYLF